MAPSAMSSPMGAHEMPGPGTNGIPALNGELDVIHLTSSTSGHLSNGHANGHISSSRNSSPDDLLDLLCIGFGPASLAIAIALHDSHKTPPASPQPEVLFLEKQPHFAWHAGMQLPGAKMQISFLKDLATPRDPTSHFTFLNYLFKKGRLNHFINLSTFLPTRVEYEDYLRWCAEHFEKEGKVEYGMDVNGLRVGDRGGDGKVTSFEVTASDSKGDVVTRRARHVVIAVGGRPVVPKILQGLKHVAHSSQFANTIENIQSKDRVRPLWFAVLGSGQSAVEIFNDLWNRFPDARVSLIIKGASLRPSDDSPFVNEIFDPDRVDGIYNQNSSERAAAIALDRGTNYGVVRLELLEHLYEKLYMQRLQNPDEKQWRCRIIPNRTVLSASQGPDSTVTLKLGAPNPKDGQDEEDELEVDYVFTATGYLRNAHKDMLRDIRVLLPDALADEEKLPVARGYKVEYDDNKVAKRAGIWLQGCNEGTHGLSDTLLSILAVRGGELVQSIFGDD